MFAPYSYGYICRRILLPFVTALSPAHRQFRSLEAWVLSGRSLGAALRDVELGTELRGRRALRLLVQAHVRARGTGDVGPAVVLRVPGVGRPRVLLRQRRPRRLPFLTIFGRIGIERTSYAAGRGASVCPLDEDLQLPARAYSHVVQYRLVKRAVQSTFRESADGLRAETGERTPVRSVEAVLADGSVDFDAFYATLSDEQKASLNAGGPRRWGWHGWRNWRSN